MEKLLLYCTKANPYLYGCYGESDDNDLTFGGFGYNVSYCPTEDENSINRTINLNGTIVAECECDLVEKIIFCRSYDNEDNYFFTNNLYPEELSKKSCLEHYEIEGYLVPTSLQGEKKGYALHLKNVKVLNFDEQNRFGSFNCLSSNSEIFKPIKRAPQNMMKVYYGDGEIISQEKYILISIRPEHLVHILNGIKTIEVRKRIVNELKELIV